MNPIAHVKGDCIQAAKQLARDGAQVLIPHITNNIGAWGSGFVTALSREWEGPEATYRSSEVGTSLGKICYWGQGGIIVVNMCAQNGIMSHSTGDRSQVNNKPIRYAALVECMNAIKMHFGEHRTICAPKFGSDRAGGNWDFIEELIDEIWVPHFYEVIICSL